jgi:predicted phage terminase large subunit-like protein
MLHLTQPEIDNALKPQDGPQWAFMESAADIAIFGGAAGSGKSWALMLEPLRNCTVVPGFDAVMFRRNTTDLRKPGGLWSETMRIYPHTGGLPSAHRLEWRWPGFGSVKLAHLEYDDTVFDWHGSQVPLICFDELTTFTRFQFFYMLSRNRSTTGISPYIRASCNADAGSWVAELIDWWIDKDTGYPILDRSGILRWFVRGDDDTLRWGDTPEQAVSHTGQPTGTAKSLTFVAAKLADNPALMERDPAYLSNLMMLPTVERERLLNGNWRIRPSAGLYFNRTWCQVIDIAPKVIEIGRGWDLAATPETPENDPDWTASVKMARLADGRYLVMDANAFRGSPADVERRMFNTATQDGYATRVGIPQDPGQAGKHQVASLVKMLAGYAVEFSPETGDKITRFSPFSAQCEAGNVMVLRGQWNERWFQMLEGFPELPHDDDCDATARAFQLVTQGNLAEWLRL